MLSHKKAKEILNRDEELYNDEEIEKMTEVLYQIAKVALEIKSTKNSFEEQIDSNS